ncbi:hypothetical protein Nizo2806_2472 [Lactiplantibacillus plantarum]|nr:hypothetical protein Nizo2806_2472 [Lactiplantibacillus plantarum]
MTTSHPAESFPSNDLTGISVPVVPILLVLCEFSLGNQFAHLGSVEHHNFEN